MANEKRVPLGTLRGQTVIETVFMIIILLILFFFIAEFARAWYLKNSLNNAVRVAVRVAAVTPNLAPDSGIVNCPAPANPVIDAVCSSPGVPGDARTKVRITRPAGGDVEPLGGNFTSGDTVTVGARSDFSGVALGFILPDFAESEASMRYE